MSKVDFRKAIKKQMKKQKINTPELARRICVNAQTVYNYLAGRTEMTSKNLQEIFSILNISIIIH